MNNPKYIIVHHSGGTDMDPLADSSNFTVDQCNELHKQKFNMVSQLGYYVGYHYYIEKDGKVTKCRNESEEGAHTIGLNTQSIGICLAGNFDLTLPTLEQENALRQLLISIRTRFTIPIEYIVPHRKFANKTCYGNRLSDTWASGLILNKEDIIKRVVALIAEATSLLALIK